MKKASRILVLLLAAALVAGCAVSDIKTPLDLNLDRTELGSKTGVATAYSVLWLFAWGNAGYAEAAKNGGITVMRHADQETFAILGGLFTRWRVVVYGD
ncbi:MAG: TRL domain-containing protein [Thermodesulfobacteriota bacterium]